MVAIEQVDFQRNGVVGVISAATGARNSKFEYEWTKWRDIARRAAQLSEALPGTMHGVHICFPQKSEQSFQSFLFSALVNVAVSALNPLLKVRVRIHRGRVVNTGHLILTNSADCR